jgi:hypothetical protein
VSAVAFKNGYERWSAEWLARHRDRWNVGTGTDLRARYYPAKPVSRAPGPRRLPESNESVKTIRALEEQLRSHVAVKGIEQ